MKKSLFAVTLIFLAISAGHAQNIRPVTTMGNNEYPQVTPDLRVVFRVNAPFAKKVQISLGKTYDLAKDEQGVWTGTTDPQDPGFHYYSLVIDSVAVIDPASDVFFGTGRMSSGIEIPEKGGDYYTVKDVPHGDISAKWYFSKTTNAWRRFYIYCPPGYDKDISKKYPVLYLQHGGGEDETGWVKQGKVDIILDNLIAEKKAVPMLVVMENSNAVKPGETGRGMMMGGAPGSNEWMSGPSTFKEVLINDLIPFIDKSYRSFTDREHRAMAGLSMGGFLTVHTVFEHPETFAYLGAFSGGMRVGPDDDISKVYHGILNDVNTFNKKFKVFFQSIGTDEGPWPRVKQNHEVLLKKGINNVYVESPGTAHEWLTWRRSLHAFAPLLFK